MQLGKSPELRVDARPHIPIAVEEAECELTVNRNKQVRQEEVKCLRVGNEARAGLH